MMTLSLPVTGRSLVLTVRVGLEYRTYRRERGHKELILEISV